MASTKTDFSQNDPRWKFQLLGFSTYQTMGRYGCVVTTIANIAQAHGYDVTPADVNDLLKARGLFVMDSVGQRSDVAGAGALTKLFPDIKHIDTQDWGRAKADVAYFDIRNSKTNDIWVKIDYHPNSTGLQEHHCRVIGVNKARTDVEVVDSYTGKRIWLGSLGQAAPHLIYRAYKYRGPGSGFVVNIAPTPPTTMVTIHMNGGVPGQQWNVRTSPNTGDNIRTDGWALPGQTYSAEILENGWARILFRSAPGFVGPKTFTKL